MNWYVARTKPGYEKKLRDMVVSRGIEAYIPIRKTLCDAELHTAGISETVLEEGKVYIHATEEERKSLFNISILLRFDGSGTSRPLIIPDRQMESLIRSVDIGNEID